MYCKIIINRHNSRGAMFGLDARIALAIFGALSVISGAALFSAIQQANITKTITTFENISKTISEYILNTGQDIPYFSTASHRLDHRYLLSSPPTSISESNTPYLSYKLLTLSANNNSLIVPELDSKQLFIRYYTDQDTTAEQIATSCSSGNPCYYWIVLGNPAGGTGLTLDFVKNMDSTFDDGSETTGNIRYYKNATTNKYSLGYMSYPRLNQP